uniref:Uncharacterized protein n=1 Tax=Odontella aurita TaxID=265563 RepID=A0A6U6DED2_9STRA|mmetsp:Transcript_1994/g.5265  ORF Transcript_1994/g.5265 Transcript_1994/m.5265 type:complete len:364 (+) Transcript_1994:80-1171(+)
MGIHSRPRHRHSTSLSSIESEDVSSLLGGCFDEFTTNELFWGETGNHTNDFSQPPMPPSIRMQDGGQPTRPLRSRLGAGSAIAAMTSPEIRALDLPFTPPVRRDHRKIMNLSPSTMSDTSSPASSLCSATPSSSNSIGQLLASLEKFEAGNLSDENVLTETCNSSSGLQSSARSAMDSILEESGENTEDGKKAVERKPLRPKIKGKVRSRDVSAGILIPTFSREVRGEKVQTEGRSMVEGGLSGENGELVEKENAMPSVSIQPRRQGRHFGGNVANKEHFSAGARSHHSRKTASAGMKLKLLKEAEFSRKTSSQSISHKVGEGKGGGKQALLCVGPKMSKNLSARTLPFRERNPNINANASFL